jgi:uncharacterized membrane protein
MSVYGLFTCIAIINLEIEALLIISFGLVSSSSHLVLCVIGCYTDTVADAHISFDSFQGDLVMY